MQVCFKISFEEDSNFLNVHHRTLLQWINNYQLTMISYIKSNINYDINFNYHKYIIK